MNGEPRRLIEDPDAPNQVARDIQEAIELGVSGPGIGPECVLDRLDTSIAILEEDLEDEGSDALPRTRHRRRVSAAVLVVFLALALTAAFIAWMLQSGTQ